MKCYLEIRSWAKQKISVGETHGSTVIWLATKAQMRLVGSSLPACAASSVWQVYDHHDGSLVGQ